MSIYLKFGDTIKGSSTDKAFPDQIEISTVQWGAGVGVVNDRNADRTTSKASVSEITLSKNLDKSTEGLFKALLLGEPEAKVTLSFTAATKGESIAYLTLDLEQVIVSSYSMSSGGDFPVESLSLNFTKFDFCFTGREKDQSGSPTHLIYSLVEHTVG